MASRFFTIGAFTLSNEKLKRERKMTTEATLATIYLVAALMMASFCWSRLRDPWYYRLICSIVVGAFWPIPACLILFLYLEGLVIDIAKWIEKNF